MPSEPRRWVFRIRHILDAIAECRDFVGPLDYDQFRADPKTLKAVTWNIAMIGEAAGQVPEAVRSTYPEVPWADMRRMRNQIVHGYDSIDFDIVWEVVHRELPPLVALLERICREAGE
jgi:uncharacterized protein with HEPN domain